MIIFRIIRKITTRIIGKRELTPIYEHYVELKDEKANDFIYDTLVSDNPCMITKFGTIELNALVSFICNNQKKYTLKDYILYFTGKKPTLWWGIKLNSLCSNAGFFPNKKELLGRFYSEYEAAILNTDIIASYIENEKYFDKELMKATRVNLESFYAPFLMDNPWTRALKNKRVLVVHPFAEEVKLQYSKRKLIWNNEDVLPEFELLTYKPVVSMLNNKTEFKDWFEALHKMKDDISKLNFDIALVGCGAYGMPLSSFIKNQGKQSIQLAGWTQMLFGIKGKRWDDQPRFSAFYNEHWIRPNQNSKPEGFDKVEDGCYW